MNTYIIKKINQAPTEEDWNLANVAHIDLSPWEGIYHFNSFAKLLYSDEAIYVRMETDEMPVVAKQTERNSPVCTDSCMEFFFRPNLNNNVYINIEINALGTLLTGVGTCRQDRVYCTDNADQFEIKPQLCESGWKITYRIPFDFIRKYAGDCTSSMKGNFYKCGSDTGHAHFHVWNMIETPKPDFHRPEYFGDFVFEK